MRPQVELREDPLRVDSRDLSRRLPPEQRNDDGHEPTHDQRVAVTMKEEAGFVARPLHASGEPDLAGAAANLVFRRSLVVRQSRKQFAEFDDIAVAIFPLIEKFEIGDDLVNVHGR